jgi:retron-type reverse transcriptase
VELTPPFPADELREAIVRDLAPSEADSRLLDSLLERHVPPLITTEVLSLILGVSHKLLWAMASVPERYYRRFQIPKKSGGSREIATPRVFLKVVQRWVLLNVLYRRPLPSVVTGFAPGRGLLANASFHVGRRYLAKIDIQDFFPSIGFRQVESVYRDFGFPDKVVLLLTRLSLLDGRLPQGAPTRPQLANLVFLPCDGQLVALAGRHGVAYSRYADDLTFSGDHPIGPDFIARVISLIEGHSFRINRQKLRSSGPGERLMTTGMVVNVTAHPMRRLRRQLRARFHQAEARPTQFIEQAHQLMGWAAYVNMYDRGLGSKYLSTAKTVLYAARGGTG